MLHNHPQYCCGCVHWQEVEGDSQNINDNYSLHLLVVMSIPFYINRIRIQIFQTASIAIASIILNLVFINTSFFIISSKTNLLHLLGLSKQLQLCSQANDLQYQFQQFIIQGILILQDSNIKEHSSTKSHLNEKQTRPKTKWVEATTNLVWAVWLFFTMEQTSKHYEDCQECPQGPRGT